MTLNFYSSNNFAAGFVTVPRNLQYVWLIKLKLITRYIHLPGNVSSTCKAFTNGLRNFVSQVTRIYGSTKKTAVETTKYSILVVKKTAISTLWKQQSESQIRKLFSRLCNNTVNNTLISTVNTMLRNWFALQNFIQAMWCLVPVFIRILHTLFTFTYVAYSL